MLAWVGAENVDCGVLGVEAVVGRGAMLYAATTRRWTLAICGE